MKLLTTLNLMAALMLPLAASANEWTVTQPIASLQVYGTTQDIYLTGGLPWGSSSCPNAIYAKVP